MTDVCMMCGKPEPKEGWHISGCHDGDFEFFCSEACWIENADHLRDAVSTQKEPS
jgi:hypothetical protein